MVELSPLGSICGVGGGGVVDGMGRGAGGLVSAAVAWRCPCSRICSGGDDEGMVLRMGSLVFPMALA